MSQMSQQETLVPWRPPFPTSRNFLVVTMYLGLRPALRRVLVMNSTFVESISRHHVDRPIGLCV